jgi:hypothetical protein
MREPYLMLGVKLSTASPDNLAVFEQMMRDLEDLLQATPLTELRMAGVYVAELPSGSARSIWRDVSILLSDTDDKVGDDLQWFAHLADRKGCELSYN